MVSVTYQITSRSCLTNNPDTEDALQIMVPDRTVGLIIGRGGETIRDLQERSGCHINIVGEQKSVNGLRPVNLIGSQEAAKRAKDLIMEIVDSDIRSQAGGAGPAPSGSMSVHSSGQGGGGRDRGHGNVQGGYYAGGGGGGNNIGGQGIDKVAETIRVPIDAVGMIIGKGILTPLPPLIPAYGSLLTLTTQAEKLLKRCSPQLDAE